MALLQYSLLYNRAKKVIREIHKQYISTVKDFVPDIINVNQPVIPCYGGLFSYFTFLAVENNAGEILRYLIEIVAYALVKNPKEENLFARVAVTPTLSKDIVDMLFVRENYGEHLNDQMQYGNTLMHYAVLSNNVYVLDMIFKMGPIRVSSIRNNKGDTALNLSIKLAKGNPTVPSMFVQHVFKYSELISIPDSDGYTPVELAEMYNLPGVVEIISDLGTGAKRKPRLFDYREGNRKKKIGFQRKIKRTNYLDAFTTPEKGLCDPSLPDSSLFMTIAEDLGTSYPDLKNTMERLNMEDDLTSQRSELESASDELITSKESEQTHGETTITSLRTQIAALEDELVARDSYIKRLLASLTEQKETEHTQLGEPTK